MRKSKKESGLLRLIRSVRDKIRRVFGHREKVRLLYLEVTHRCNLRCICCYTEAGTEVADALTLDEQKSVVRQAKQMRARAVSLSGSGEPLLYESLRELIDYIRALGMTVVMFTNGTVLDTDTAEFLISREVVTYFKLYSLKPDVFDRMAGKKNAYEWVDYDCKDTGGAGRFRIPAGLRNLLEAQRKSEGKKLVGVEAVITRINCDSLPGVARFCRAAGLKFYLETPVFTGRAIANYESIALSKDEYRRLYHELVGILGEEYLDEQRRHPCPVERNPVVRTNGEIGFCSSRVACIGNVREVPLKELFAKAKKQKRKQDAAVNKILADKGQNGSYFRRCAARRYYEAKHRLKCNY